MSESNESDYEFEILEEMFPSANFCVSISLNKLDNVLTNNENVAIKITHDCYCYDDNPRNNEFIIVKNEGNGITYKMLINAMIKENYNPDCNHIFLEEFEKINDITYSPIFGS